MPEAWSKADLHIHSTRSDGLASPRQIMEYAARRTDLSVIAITDHNTLEGALDAKEMQHEYPGLEVVVGEEITSKWGHILGLFLDEEVPPGLSAVETIARINEQGGVAVIAHPFANRAFGPFGQPASLGAAQGRRVQCVLLCHAAHDAGEGQAAFVGHHLPSAFGGQSDRVQPGRQRLGGGLGAGGVRRQCAGDGGLFQQGDRRRGG